MEKYIEGELLTKRIMKQNIEEIKHKAHVHNKVATTQEENLTQNDTHHQSIEDPHDKGSYDQYVENGTGEGELVRKRLTTVKKQTKNVMKQIDSKTKYNHWNCKSKS